MSQFQPGDQVRLRSGGPPLTVVSVHAKSGEVKCGWFDADQAFHQEHFPPGALVLLESPAAPGPSSGDGSMGKILAESMKKQQETAKQKRGSSRK
jgi:uncharacterized protein YodC (DUF2158 family)